MSCLFKTIFTLFFLFALVVYPTSLRAESEVKIVTPIKRQVGRNETQLLKTATEEGRPATASLMLAKRVNVLVERLQAASLRLENLFQRISTRQKKIQKLNAKAKRLSRQIANLNTQIKKLKTGLKQTEKLAQNLNKSSNPQKDYPSFRNQAISVDRLLANILNLEKNLIVEFNKFAAPSASISATLVPKK